MMLDYNFTPETIYEEARKVELEAMQLYLNACEAIATACTATAPYVFTAYSEAENGLRCRYLDLLDFVIDAEDERALNALISARTFLDVVRRRLFP